MANKLSIEQVFQSKLGTSVRPQNIIRFFEKAMKAIKSQKQQMSNDKDSMDPLSLL